MGFGFAELGKFSEDEKVGLHRSVLLSDYIAWPTADRYSHGHWSQLGLASID
jgi:hypothetical protein